jgi:peptidoglycan/LPS O-acetylase OafA/YrhL
MQFYAGVALLFSLLGRRGLILLPAAAIAFTGLRAVNDVWASSVTWFRIDEILAGCTLALAIEGRSGRGIGRFLAAVPQPLIAALFFFSCFDLGWSHLLRPYLAAILVGTTLCGPQSALARALNGRVLAYIAAVSYALYVLHPLVAASWLGSGDTLEKYLKRPLLFLALFAAAHLSTFHYERHWIALGKRLGEDFARRRGPAFPESRGGGGGS